jgi:hypothetical protein
MPLKHSTETLLVVILALAIVLAGVVCAILPPIATSILPWSAAFAVSIIYPLTLYPLFKERRADYEFRALHFVPALMLFVWLVLQLLVSVRPGFAFVLHWYTWGWTFVGVFAAFLLLIWFCMHVIRQWSGRLTFIIPLLGLFLIFAVVSQARSLPSRITEALFGGGSSSSIIAVATSSSSITSVAVTSAKPSSEQEAAWQMQQRVMQRRDLRLKALSGTVTVHSATDGALIAMTGVPPIKNGSHTPPPHLPSSGAETEVFFVGVVALYCGLIHQRARMRFVD